MTSTKPKLVQKPKPVASPPSADLNKNTGNSPEPMTGSFMSRNHEVSATLIGGIRQLFSDYVAHCYKKIESI